MFEKTTLNDLKNILCSSVVRHNNRPAIIQNIGEDGDKPMWAHYIDKGEEFFSHWNDPAWNFEPVPLGFANSDNQVGTLYIYRVPNRQYRVGLHNDNVKAAQLTTSCDTEFGKMRMRELASQFSRGVSLSKKNISLAKCISGVYPSINEAFELLESGKKTSIGISREFAVDGNFCLFFRTDMVGVIGENGVPTFSRGRNYLNRFWEMMHVRN